MTKEINNGMTHYEGCWIDLRHKECARERIRTAIKVSGNKYYATYDELLTSILEQVFKDTK